jgi:hypothetical protein
MIFSFSETLYLKSSSQKNNGKGFPEIYQTNEIDQIDDLNHLNVPNDPNDLNQTN